MYLSILNGDGPSASITNSQTIFHDVVIYIAVIKSFILLLTTVG